MPTVGRWTGHDVRALRQALRLTVRDFAAYLGVSTRTVSLWEAGTTRELRPASQQILDTALHRADAGAQERFALLRRREDNQPVGVRATPDGQPRRPGARLPFGIADHIPELLRHLREQWHALVRTDNLLGPRYALAGVLDQIAIIEDNLPLLPRVERVELVRLGGMYAESAAWLYEDAGKMAAAAQWVGRAMEWAHEADDRPMLAWVLFRRSQHATGECDGQKTLSLASAAGRASGDLPGPMRAAIIHQEAYGHALEGDEQRTHRTLDQALQWAAQDTTGDARSGHGSFCTVPYLELQRANCWATLGRPERAIEHFEVVLPTLPAVYRRDRGVACGRLARVYASTGQVEAAAHLGREALEIARSSGSTRTEQAVARLGRQLARHQRLAPVRDLLDELATA
jgi:transcriptional regulator with XRE-family HTH domain